MSEQVDPVRPSSVVAEFLALEDEHSRALAEGRWDDAEELLVKGQGLVRSAEAWAAARSLEPSGRHWPLDDGGSL